MLIVDTGGGNRDLAERAARIARQYPHRTQERRAAAMVYAAAMTTRTTDGARRALATFGDPSARAAADALLAELERERT
jgi:hypothetical protein